MSDDLKTNYTKLNKRYQEIKNQLADIEAKLAESEKQIKDAREAGNMAVDSWCKNRRKYEAQIAEMQNKSFILYSMLYETLEKQGCDNVASQIDQMTGWTYDKEADWLKGNRNYDQLKHQLAEKDKEIKQLKLDLGMFRSVNEFLNGYGIEKAREVLLQTEKTKQQDKISFALDILEELADCSNYINSKLDFECGSYVSEKAIRDKIKYLQGKKDE